MKIGKRPSKKTDPNTLTIGSVMVAATPHAAKQITIKANEAPAPSYTIPIFWEGRGEDATWLMGATLSSVFYEQRKTFAHQRQFAKLNAAYTTLAFPLP